MYSGTSRVEEPTLVTGGRSKQRSNSIPPTRVADGSGQDPQPDLSRRFSLLRGWTAFKSGRKSGVQPSAESSPPRSRLNGYSKKFFDQFRSRSKSQSDAGSPPGRAEGNFATEGAGIPGSAFAMAVQRGRCVSNSCATDKSGARVTQSLLGNVDEVHKLRPCTPSVFSDTVYTGRRRMTEIGNDVGRVPLGYPSKETSDLSFLTGPAPLRCRNRRLSEPASTFLRSRLLVRAPYDMESWLNANGSSMPISSLLDDVKIFGAYSEHAALSSSPRYYMLENREQIYAQFIKSHRCYDLIPTSSKLVVFDTELAVKKAFFALVYNSVRAAPLWESKSQQFVGMLTITDFITILHKYYKTGEDNVKGLEEHRICSWREELMTTGKLQPLCTIEVMASLIDAVRLLCEKKVHRLPVVDSSTGNVLYILTHKRILRFLYLYMNDLPQPSFLTKSPKELGIGTWSNIHTVKKTTKLIEVLRKFLELRVSALPVVDEDNRVVDIYAKFDVINLAADKAYNNLDVSVFEALKHRSAWFEGVHSCTANDSMKVYIDTLVKSEVHRLVVVDSEKRVEGMVSLSDILAFVVLRPEEASSVATIDENSGVEVNESPKEDNMAAG